MITVRFQSFFNCTFLLKVIFDPPGSQLSNGHPCVENDCPAMSIDRELTGYPSAMVRICPETCQRLKTAPVELIYAGAYDPQQVLGEWLLDFGRDPRFRDFWQSRLQIPKNGLFL